MNSKSTRTMENQGPLRGKTIVITRAQHQAAEFGRLLNELGAQVIEFPTIEIVQPDSWTPVDEAIQHLHVYDWIVFTSANGVRAFVARLGERGVSIGGLEEIRLCAIGPGTAAEMKAQGLEPCFVPSEYRAEAVVQGLAREGLSDKRILLARAKKAREVLPRELKKRGARVDVVAVYQTVRPKSETSRLLRLLEERRIDAIAFTSSSTVSNFVEMFASKRDEILSCLRDVVIAVIGPITQERALKLGIPVHIAPAEYTIRALTHAMAEYFSARR